MTRAFTGHAGTYQIAKVHAWRGEKLPED